jgi:cytochrome b involved in lipid metabolism
MVAKLLRMFERPTSSSTASWSIATCFCYYSRLYAAPLVLLTLLSALTVYRREMSCNRVYTEDDDIHANVKDRHKVVGEASDRWEESTEELLEGAGAYCSGQPLQPLFDVALSLWASICFDFLTQGEVEEKKGQWLLPPSDVSSMRRKRESLGICHSTRSEAHAHHSDNITRDLPADVQVHLLSFLHPKDVVSFACTSRSSLAIVDKGETSMTLWRTLWRRDYAWLVHSWSVGIDALRRSQPFQEVVDKRFYFMFGQSYVNYILAGHNSFEQCLVGLHGHIYDITAFLHVHPGSPDTLMVQSGKDATKYFEDMTHSSGARHIARSVCVVVDGFCFEDGCGVHPTVLTGASGPLVPRAMEAPTIPMARTREQPHPGTLQSIRREFLKQQRLMAHKVRTRFASNPNVLSHVNLFYDPFRCEWKAWYTDDQFKTVYIDTI